MNVYMCMRDADAAADDDDAADTTMMLCACDAYNSLNTIADYDKVLVMSGGRAVEYDSPFALLSKPDAPHAVFKSLVTQTGESNAALILDMATDAHQRSSQRRAGATVTASP